MLSKEVSNAILKVFGMTRPWIEPRSPGPLVNTLPIWPMSDLKCVVAIKLLLENQDRVSVYFSLFLTVRLEPYIGYGNGTTSYLVQKHYNVPFVTCIGRNVVSVTINVVKVFLGEHQLGIV